MQKFVPVIATIHIHLRACDMERSDPVHSKVDLGFSQARQHKQNKHIHVYIRSVPRILYKLRN